MREVPGVRNERNLTKPELSNERGCRGLEIRVGKLRTEHKE